MRRNVNTDIFREKSSIYIRKCVAWSVVLYALNSVAMVFSLDLMHWSMAAHDHIHLHLASPYVQVFFGPRTNFVDVSSDSSAWAGDAQAIAGCKELLAGSLSP